MPYELSDFHTSADVGMVVSGGSLQEIFCDAAIGLTEIMVDLDGLESRKQLVIELENENLEDLFYQWLSDIIYFKDVESFLVKRCDIDITADPVYKLKAVLYGDEIDYSRQTLKVDVKAVTYYKFRIEKVGDHWQGEVVFDL
jgi:SHS2 domain-containing protein